MNRLHQALLACNLLVMLSMIWYVCYHPPSSTQYVLTPFYQTVPEGSTWTVAEVEALGGEMPNALEARDMANGYARLGSTLSVDDVIKGIDGLAQSDYPLSPSQQSEIQQEIQRLIEERRQIMIVQQDLLQLERRLSIQAKKWGLQP